MMNNINEINHRQRDQMVAMLRRLVEIESPSHEKAAVDRMGEQVIAYIRASGGEDRRLECQEAGDIVLGQWQGRSGNPAILLLAHMDTVWPIGTLAERPLRIENQRLYGPGAVDMKAGIVIALTALQSLQQLGIPLAAPVNLLCTSDEEIGSHAAQSIIEKLAAQSQLALCLEPALPGGALKTARKGVGKYTISTTGRAAHAGADHAKGVNAIEEMAHHILALQAMTRYNLGTTVSVGVIRGGAASNVVPDACEIEVDFRVSVPQEAQRLHEEVMALRPRLPGTSLRIEGGLHRPPMERDERMIQTFAKACQIASRHGFSLQEGSTGGASDANLTAALGIPTLDGLGADGDGMHSVNEYVEISSLPHQAALLAALLSEWR